jgi:hypothetical protein
MTALYAIALSNQLGRIGETETEEILDLQIKTTALTWGVICISNKNLS